MKDQNRFHSLHHPPSNTRTLHDSKITSTYKSFTETFLENEGRVDEATKLKIIAECLKKKKNVNEEEDSNNNKVSSKKGIAKIQKHKHNDRQYNGGKSYEEMIGCFVERFAESPEHLRHGIPLSLDKGNSSKAQNTYYFEQNLETQRTTRSAKNKLNNREIYCELVSDSEDNGKGRKISTAASSFASQDYLLAPDRYEEKRLLEILPDSLRHNKEFKQIREEQNITALSNRRKFAEKWMACKIPTVSKTLEFQAR